MNRKMERGNLRGERTLAYPVNLPNKNHVNSAVCASGPQGFEDCFAAVFADKNFSAELVVGTIPCFMSRRSTAPPTDQLRLKTMLHEACSSLRTSIIKRVKEIQCPFGHTPQCN